MTLQEAFDRFRNGAIGTGALQSTLARELRTGDVDPKTCLVQLDEWYARDLLSGEAYRRLRDTITDVQENRAPPPAAAAPPPAAGAAPPRRDVSAGHDPKTRLQHRPPTGARTPRAGTGTVVMGGTGTLVMPAVEAPAAAGGPANTGAPAATGAFAAMPGSGSRSTGMEGGLPVPGAVLDGQFVLEQRLGEGGMGSVWKALDLRAQAADDRNPYVAVKVLASEFRYDPKFLTALQREAKKSQLLAHPNIVNVFMFDFDDHAAWIVMECLDGKPLSRVRRTDLDMAQRFDVLAQAAAGLSHAHAMQPAPIVHYDIKPSNVFLTSSGTVKVLDFGIARGVPMERTIAKMDRTTFDPASLGALTPGYASPEMIREEPADVRDDVFSFACLAYEFLSGRHPFDRRWSTEAEQARLPVQRIKGLSRRQHQAFVRALHYERAKRTPSVARFMEELLPTRAERRRGPGPMWWGTGAMVASAAVATVAWQMLPAERAAAVAADARALAGGLRARIDALRYAPLPATVDEVRALDGDARTALRAHPAAPGHLAALWQSEISRRFAPSEARYDWAEAQALLDELSGLLPAGDAAVAGVARSLAQARAQAVARHERLREGALQAQRLLPTDGAEHLLQILARLRLLAPAHPALGGERIAADFAAAAARARRAANFDRAARLLDAAAEVAGEQAVLAQERTALADARRTRERFDAALAAGDLTAAGQALAAWRAAAPDAAVLATAGSALAEAHVQRARALAANDPAAAAGHLDTALRLAPEAAPDAGAELQSLRDSLLRAQLDELRQALDERLGAADFTREDLAWSARRIAELEARGGASADARARLTRRVVDVGAGLIDAGDAPAAYDLALYAETFAVLAGRDELVGLRDRALNASTRAPAAADASPAAARGTAGPLRAAPAAAAPAGSPPPADAAAPLGGLLASDDLLDPLVKSRVRRFWRDTCDAPGRRAVADAYRARADVLQAAGAAGEAAAHRDFIDLLAASADTCN